MSAVWLYGEAGLIWFIVVQPLTTIAIALRYTRRLPQLSAARPGGAALWAAWKPMAKLGAAFMPSSLATAATLFLVRSFITRELGLGAARQFAAAWGITMTYVGFLLTAMSADYYPRLAEVINDCAAATRLMNDQVQLELAIGEPVLLLVIGLAPWAISLLYSAELGPSAELLQWQTLGNVLMLASWPLAFSIVAAARSKAYFLMELSFNILFLTMVWLLLPIYGLKVTAIAFLAGYAVYFATLNVLARSLQGFRWQLLSIGLLALHGTLGLALLLLALIAPQAGAVTSVALTLGTGLIGLRTVLIKVGPEGRIAARLVRLYSAIGWPIRSIS